MVLNPVYLQYNNLLDKNGNRLDEECSHTQKDAKTPELARKFLQDTATLFYKEQAYTVYRLTTY